MHVSPCLWIPRGCGWCIALCNFSPGAAAFTGAFQSGRDFGGRCFQAFKQDNHHDGPLSKVIRGRQCRDRGINTQRTGQPSRHDESTAWLITDVRIYIKARYRLRDRPLWRRRSFHDQCDRCERERCGPTKISTNEYRPPTLNRSKGIIARQCPRSSRVQWANDISRTQCITLCERLPSHP